MFPTLFAFLCGIYWMIIQKIAVRISLKQCSRRNNPCTAHSYCIWFWMFLTDDDKSNPFSLFSFFLSFVFLLGQLLLQFLDLIFRAVQFCHDTGDVRVTSTSAWNFVFTCNLSTMFPTQLMQSCSSMVLWWPCAPWPPLVVDLQKSKVITMKLLLPEINLLLLPEINFLKAIMKVS